MIELFNMDCMAFMANLPDKAYDLAIVDPPYGILRKREKLNHGAGKLKNRAFNTMNVDWDKAPPSPEYFMELFRVSKNQIIWGGNYFNLPPTRCMVVWDKIQPWDNFSQVEIAWTSFDYPAKIFRYGVKDPGNHKKIHPTQKPVKLYKYLLKTFAKPGDTILDTHCGSGSILIASHDMGYGITATELDEQYYNSALKRYRNHAAQMMLFNETLFTKR